MVEQCSVEYINLCSYTAKHAWFMLNAKANLGLIIEDVLFFIQISSTIGNNSDIEDKKLDLKN